MINVIACSRQGVRNVLSRITGSTVVISIRDPDKTPEFEFGETFPFVCDIMQTAFWDEVDDEYGCISVEQAERIAEFVRAYALFVTNIVVNCEGGVSRSAGVAAAISKYFNRDDNQFFDPRQGRYIPNMTCYRRILDALYFTNQGFAYPQ